VTSRVSPDLSPVFKRNVAQSGLWQCPLRLGLLKKPLGLYTGA
jgi:hypothetical protein